MCGWVIRSRLDVESWIVVVWKQFKCDGRNVERALTVDIAVTISVRLPIVTMMLFKPSSDPMLFSFHVYMPVLAPAGWRNNTMLPLISPKCTYIPSA
jgi:hypothetical protein